MSTEDEDEDEDEDEHRGVQRMSTGACSQPEVPPSACGQPCTGSQVQAVMHRQLNLDGQSSAGS